MKKNNPILVYLGANAHKKLVHKLLKLNPDIRFISSHIFPETSSSLLYDKIYTDSVITFDSSIQIKSGEIQFTKINDYNLVNIIEDVMNDKNLPLLWTRFKSETRRCNHSEVKRYEVLYSLIKSSLETCLTINPGAVVFSYEPHMLPMYIFKQVASALRIRTYTLIISPFVWRLFCEVDNGNSDHFFEEHQCKKEGINKNESVKKLINEKQGEYRVAKPFYEKRDLTNLLGARIFKKFKINGWNPNRVLRCHWALSEYKRASSARNEFHDLKYISVFLQYQPELTTLPDGHIFVNQLFAIQMLYSAVSQLGIALVIREHPATFESVYDPKWRPRDFYRSIKNIGSGIYFDDINSDPFTLIENSVAVSSITGSVILEALLRGKPAIAFGKHPLRGFVSAAFVDKFENENKLREKIIKALKESPQAIIDNIEKYLYEVYPSTFGDKHYMGNEGMTLEKLRELRYNALLQVFDLIPKGKFSH